MAEAIYRADNYVYRDAGVGLVTVSAVTTGGLQAVARNTVRRGGGSGLIDVYAVGSKLAGNFIGNPNDGVDFYGTPIKAYIGREAGDGDIYMTAVASTKDSQGVNVLYRGAGTGNIVAIGRGSGSVINNIRTAEGFNGSITVIGDKGAFGNGPNVQNTVDRFGYGNSVEESFGLIASNNLTWRGNAQSNDGASSSAMGRAYGVDFAGNDFLIADSSINIAGVAVATNGNAVNRVNDLSGMDGQNGTSGANGAANGGGFQTNAAPGAASGSSNGVPLTLQALAGAYDKTKVGIWAYNEVSGNAIQGFKPVVLKSWSAVLSRNYLKRPTGSYGDYWGLSVAFGWAHNGVSMGAADGKNTLWSIALVGASNNFSRDSGDGNVSADAWGGFFGWNQVTSGTGAGDVYSTALGALLAVNIVGRGSGVGDVVTTGGSLGFAVNVVNTESSGIVNEGAISGIASINYLRRSAGGGNNYLVGISAIAAVNWATITAASTAPTTSILVAVGAGLGGFNQFTAFSGSNFVVSVAGGLIAGFNYTAVGNGDNTLVGVAVGHYLAGNYSSVGDGYNVVVDIAVSGFIAGNFISGGKGSNKGRSVYTGVAIVLPFELLPSAPVLAFNIFALSGGSSAADTPRAKNTVVGLAVNLGYAATNVVVSQDADNVIVNFAASAAFAANFGVLGNGNNTIVGVAAAFAPPPFGFGLNYYQTGQSGSAKHGGVVGFAGGFSGSDYSVVVEAAYGTSAAFNAYASKGGSQFITTLAVSQLLAGNLVWSGAGNQTILAAAVTLKGLLAFNVIITGGEESKGADTDNKNIIAVAYSSPPIDIAYITSLSANLIFSGAGDDFIAAIAVNKSTISLLGGFAISASKNVLSTIGSLFGSQSESESRGGFPATLNVVSAGNGNNTVLALGMANLIMGGSGDDTLIALGQTNFMLGGAINLKGTDPGPEVFMGTPRPRADSAFKDLQSFHALDPVYGGGDHGRNFMVAIGAENFMLGSNGSDKMFSVATQSNIMGAALAALTRKTASWAAI